MARICRYPEQDGRYYLCFDHRSRLDLQNVFYNRYYLHTILYQHPKIVGFDVLVGNLLSCVVRLKLINIQKALQQLFDDTDDNYFQEYNFLDDNIIFNAYNTYRLLLSQKSFDNDKEFEQLFDRYISHKLYPLVQTFSIPLKSNTEEKLNEY